MKSFLLTALFAGYFLSIGAQTQSDEQSAKLVLIIKNAPEFDSLKIRRIDSIRLSLIGAADQPLPKQFGIEETLYEEYKLFKYDSAYLYARNLLQQANRIGDPSLITGAKLKMSFILLSAGLYKETYDTLATISILDKPDALKAEYYTLMGRYYYDIAGYDNDHYHSVDYDIIGTRYMDSALMFYPSGSFEEIYYRGLKEFKGARTETALPFFNQLISGHALTDHQYALVASTMSGIYLQNNNTSEAIKLLSQAAAGHTNYGDGGNGLMTTDGLAGGLSVADGGYIEVTADFNSNTWTATKTDWGIIGDATPAGWDNSTNMIYDESSQTWMLTAVMKQAGSFKFRANNEWKIDFGI